MTANVKVLDNEGGQFKGVCKLNFEINTGAKIENGRRWIKGRKRSRYHENGVKESVDDVGNVEEESSKHEPNTDINHRTRNKRLDK